VDKFKFPFPLLSDPDKAIATAYGAVKPLGVGIQRSVVLIEKDCTVVYAVRGAPSPAEVVAALDT